MDDQQFRAAATATIDEIITYYGSLAQRPVVSTVAPGYLRPLLPVAAPEQGEAWEAIRADLEAKIVPGLTHWQSPNFFAFFPCPSSYPSILGELYSATYAAAAFNWICSPAITELETVVMDWLVQLLGLPADYAATGPTGGGGVLHGTASEAVLTMMTAAADRHLRAVLGDVSGCSEEEVEDRRAERRGRLVALGGAAAHASTKKAARVLGLRFRAVPTSAADGFRMTGAALQQTLATVRAAGLEPFFLTATFGTTDTCAVDDFVAVADVLDAHQALVVAAARAADTPAAPAPWVHVDAAYAGSALVLPEVQTAFSSAGTAVLQRFDSFNFNMHKWLLTNFDASCVFVRNRRWLADALAADAHYYRNDYSDGGLVTDYRDWQIPLGRRFRSLKVWFVLRSYGADGLRAYIRRSLRLGTRFADGLPADHFDIVTGPRFALTVFRCRPRPGEDLDATSARTRRVYEAVNAGGTIWVTATNLDGKGAAIRVMTANHLTEEAHVDAALAIFREAAKSEE